MAKKKKYPRVIGRRRNGIEDPQSLVSIRRATPADLEEFIQKVAYAAPGTWGTFGFGLDDDDLDAGCDVDEDDLFWGGDAGEV